MKESLSKVVWTKAYTVANWNVPTGLKIFVLIKKKIRIITEQFGLKETLEII